MLKITFLGTGASLGIPIIGSSHPVCLSKDPRDKRLRTSVLIQWDEYSYVIDCGPDFRQQMLRSRRERLEGILFTHEHADHTSGIDDIRPYFFKQGTIPLYGSERVINNLSERFKYIFKERKPRYGPVVLSPNKISANQDFFLHGKKVIPVEAMHYDISSLGYRIDNFAYLTDVKTISAKELKKLENLDVLTLNAIRIEKHKSHLNLEEALELIRQIQPKKCYLTHISHLLGFHEEASKNLPKSVFLAYDNLIITSG